MRKAKLGKKLSLEHREKLAKHLRSLDNTFRFKKGSIPHNKGKKHKEESVQKIRLSKIGKKASEETKKKMSISHKGKIPLHVLRGDMSGEKNPRWIKDRSLLKRYKDSEEKRSPAYKYWRKTVCDRDNWKCRMNNEDCSGRLEVHHILAWRDYPELRYEKNNGICLCKFHHPRKREDEIRLSPYFQEIIINLN